MGNNNQKIGGGGFHHVAITVKDFDKSLKFYTEGLGFRKDIGWGEGDSRAVMLDTGDGNYIEIFAGGKEDVPEGSWLHVAFRTDNCDLALEQARAAGAPVTMEPTDIDIQSNPVTKVRIAFCKGPDGETLEFFQYR